MGKVFKWFLYIGLIILLLEVAAYFITQLPYLKKMDYARMRNMLAREGAEGESLAKYVFIPNLGACPNPTYKNKNGVLIHNSLGYRGKEYTRAKPAGVFRIVCLGGSTTYGFNLERNEDTYPAILEGWLTRSEAFKSQDKYDSVQVINAGVEGANMFMVLSQYMYKYRLFHPDMIIVHEGINDAYAYTGKVYFPDYSHLRTNLFQYKPLSPFVRWCMHSRFVSLVVVAINMGDALMINTVVDDRAYPQWARCEQPGCDYFDPSGNAFYQNSHMLAELAHGDSAAMILMPMTYNEEEAMKPQNAGMLDAIKVHRQFWLSMAASNNAVCVDVSPTVIPPKYYYDACHLNPEGNALKVDAIGPQVAARMLEVINGK